MAQRVNMAVNRGTMTRGVRNFRENYNINPRNVPEVIYSQLTDVDITLPDIPLFSAQVIRTCVDMVEVAFTDTKMFLANHVSVLCCIFPELTETCRTALKHNSANPRIVRLPSHANDIAVIMSPPADHKWALFIFAQCVLVMFKNINPQSYDNYMIRRNQALLAEIGFQESEVPVMYSSDHARIVSIHLGREDLLKRQLLQRIIENSNESTPLGNTCAYLLTILAWTEMSALTFVYTTLLTTRSPVLSDPRVSSEVINLHAAYQAVCAQTYPQFFKILASPIEKKKLDRSKFPVLLAVAQSIMSQRQSTVSQFVVPQGSNDVLVDELVQLHLQYENQRESQSVRNYIHYLTDFGEDRTDQPENLQAAPANP